MLFSLSCSRVTKLNTVPHDFDQRANRVVWFQIAGLSEEHFAMLRFGVADSQEKTSFEENLCSGKIWNYNLYKIRPLPHEGFLSQITGKKDIKDACVDYKHLPIWSYLTKTGHHTGVFETHMAGNFSFEKAWTCGGSSQFVDNLYLWRMKKKKSTGIDYFHYQEQKPFTKPGIFYDRSCLNRSSGCYSSIFNNSISLYSRFSIKRKKFLFIVRDFSYYEALKEGNISKALEILTEIEKTYAFFNSELKKDKNMLLLLSTSSNLNFEFPKEGQKWEEFEKSGKNVVYHLPALISSVFANGAGAQNFCGTFEEFEMLKRIIFSHEKSELNLDLFDWIM